VGGISLRPHHLLCIQGFRGQGYSPSFIANMARLIDRLEAEPEQEIQIVTSADDVCIACPHLDGGVCVRPESKVDEIDGRVLEHLKIVDGDILTWSMLLQTIDEKVHSSQLDSICDGCRWVDLDYCTNGLEVLSQRLVTAKD